MAKGKKGKEELFWADSIAKEVKQSVDDDPVLQKVVKENGYICYDEKTPSGHIHIGSGRGWIIHDAIAKAMRNIGLKARFILSSDDIDPYDKPNKDLPKSWDKYLGMPFRNIPSPVEGYESFADYYFMECVEKFKEFGIDAEIESTGERYDSGKFNEQIKIALDNYKKIQAIFERIYDKPYDKIPFNVICEKCGKIGTTRAISWDKENEMLKYKCEKDFVDWAEGCGNEGEISPYNGNGKLPWKVEWAAKWPSVGVVCELAGKDHFTKGGSRDVSVAIADEVYDFPPPYPSTRKSIGKGYEFFTVGGKKMSTSKGMGISFAEISKHLSAKILRYLLIRSRPHSVIDFTPEGRNDLILLYDRYDYTERVYFKKEKVDEKEQNQQKRIYELSHVGDIPKKMPVQVSLTNAASALQIGLSEEGAIEIMKRTGHLPEKLSGIDEHYTLERLRDAKNWLEKFASEECKFSVQEKIPEGLNLTDQQKQALHMIADELKKKKYSEEELSNMMYDIFKEKLGLKPNEFFTAAYNVLLNKDKGPRLAGFILAIGVDKVVELFRSV